MYKGSSYFSTNFIKISQKRFQNFFITSEKLIIFKVTLIFIHNFPKINTEFPWSFHQTLFHNINIFKTSTKSVKIFRNFLKISMMFSTVLPKFVENRQQFFLVLPYLLKCSRNYFKILSFSSNISSKFPDIFSEFSCYNFTSCF